MRQLFVSYARENRSVVDGLVRHLNSLGHRPWMDSSLRGGQSWWDEILRRIAECDAFVAIVSQHTLTSVACQRELEWALALNKPVVPVAVGLRRDALPRQLATLQIVDFLTTAETAIDVAGSLAELPPAPALLNELPEAPTVPLSHLSELVDQVSQREPLREHEQRQILIRLEAALRSLDPDEQDGASYVLKAFNARSDVLRDVDRALSQLLAATERDKRQRVERAERCDPESVFTHPARSDRLIERDHVEDSDDIEMYAKDVELPTRGYEEQLNRLEQRRGKARATLERPTSHVRAEPKSSEWRRAEAHQAIGVLDQLRTKLNRVSDLTDAYYLVVRRRTECSRFAQRTERLYGEPSADEFRLQNQRDVAKEFDILDDPLHADVAVKIPNLRERADDYESILTSTSGLVNELRARPVDGREAYLNAEQLEKFWQKVLDELYREIRDECKRMKDLADEMKRS